MDMRKDVFNDGLRAAAKGFDHEYEESHSRGYSGDSSSRGHGLQTITSTGSFGMHSASRVVGRPPGGRTITSSSAIASASSGHQQEAKKVPLTLGKVQDKTLQSQYIFGNICAVSPDDFPPNHDGSDLYIRLTGPQLKNDYVVTSRPTPGFPAGTISLSDPQRTWCGVGMMDRLVGEIYNPFSSGSSAYIGSMDLEVAFASARKTTDTPYDPEQLEELFLKTFQNQIFAPGQKLLLDVQNIPLAISVISVTLVDLTFAGAVTEIPARSDPQARGILTNQSSLEFFKDLRSSIKLKGSSKRPAANAIIRPDFKFEDMGIGGLDDEFSTIFRRAFASRIFPPGLIEKLGIMHVKGMLLYGPPGTGKTLIARQIGKMLNAREPKVINGPEVLNKYVGQSEENIRKLFADAEKEYKEKGDESGLHIIIFDELDAVCKQRGSGVGTGVGDSVVNQLLSKLDGVDQLNNILLIGMTNRKDMIDDALLRPGRLEVQIEISLPDEFGRSQILRIHTSKMKENNVMADDVDIAELASLTKNFSGAELSGLVKSATSFAFNRHIKVGTMAGLSDDVADIKITRADFMKALEEIKPALGADDSELEEKLTYGIVHYSPIIQSVLNDSLVYVETVRQLERLRRLSVLIHGPPSSGKTALAVHIALRSNYPFVKIISPENLVGYRDGVAKKDFIHKVFSDAYKSPLSCLILDNLERLIEWNTVDLHVASAVLQALITLTRSTPPKGRRILILATTSKLSLIEQLDVASAFDRQIHVPAVMNMRELAFVLEASGKFNSKEEIDETLDLLRQYTGGSDVVQVGIKTILTMADNSLSGAESRRWFAEQLGNQIARRGAQI